MLISMRQLLDHAAENSYGLPAFNVNNMEQVHAIMKRLMPLTALLSCKAVQVRVVMRANLSCVI